MQAIETRYKGWRFRSRLEARWAVYFDTIGLRWEYEPEGFELGDGVRYLPDFWLPDVRSWAEVKPVDPTERELDKIFRLVAATDRPCVILVGSPEARTYPFVREDWFSKGIRCGLCGRADCPRPNPGSRDLAECPPSDAPSPPTGPFMDDAIVDTQYIHEHRFFASIAGPTCEVMDAGSNPAMARAISAARAARFEAT